MAEFSEVGRGAHSSGRSSCLALLSLYLRRSLCAKGTVKRVRPTKCCILPPGAPQSIYNLALPCRTSSWFSQAVTTSSLLTAIQVIDACIGITKTIINIGRAALDAQGLPPKLQDLLDKLPAIEALLEKAKANCEERRVTGDATKSVELILKQCEQALGDLRDIFRRACPNDGDSLRKRIWRSTQTAFLGRDSKVEKLLGTVQDNLRLLEQKEIYVIGDKLDAQQCVSSQSLYLVFSN